MRRCGGGEVERAAPEDAQRLLTIVPSAGFRGNELHYGLKDSCDGGESNVRTTSVAMRRGEG